MKLSSLIAVVALASGCFSNERALTGGADASVSDLDAASFDFDTTSDFLTTPDYVFQTSGTTSNLSAVWSDNTTEVLIAGAAGTLLRSVGGSSAWSMVDSGTTSALHAIAGASAHVYIVGDGGVVVTEQTPGVFTAAIETSANLYGVVAIGDVAFAVGAGGTFLRTPNGGTTWESASVPSGSVDLFAIWSDDATHLYVAGDMGTLLYSADVGNNWQVLSSGTTAALHALTGFSDGSLVAVGDATILRSADGISWTASGSTAANLEAITGPALSLLLAVGSKGTVLSFNGTVWAPQTSGTTVNLSGTWRSISAGSYVVGDDGTVLYAAP